MPYMQGIGTRVFLDENWAIVVVPPGNEIPQNLGKELIGGVRSIIVTFAPDDFIHADIDMLISSEVIKGACPRYKYFDPVSGKRIKKMEFEDGEVWEEDG